MLAAVMGLLTVAGCYFIGLSRIVLAFGLMCHVMDNSSAFPAFAQALFTEPREITGKIVCSNCHLASRDLAFHVPTLCISGKIVEGALTIPVLKTNAALRSDGSVSRMNVGGLLVFDEATVVASSVAFSSWEPNESSPGQYVFGPIASELSNGVFIAWRSPTTWAGLSKTFYVAANRGRGQIYPDGSLSNLTAWKIPGGASAALNTAVCYQPKRYGSVITLLTLRGTYLLHLPTGQPLVRAVSLKAAATGDSTLGSYINLGGFGQTEQTISFQTTGNVDTLLVYLL